MSAALSHVTTYSRVTSPSEENSAATTASVLLNLASVIVRLPLSRWTAEYTAILILDHITKPSH